MFGGKKPPEIQAHDDRDGNYTQEWEYRTLAIIGVVNFDKALNEQAAKGWELVSGCMAGTTHYGYLRRRLVA